MKFWDTSALLPVFLDEASTPACRQHMADDPGVIVWEGTCVELLSVLARWQRHSRDMDDLWPGLRAEMIRQWRTWLRVADWQRVSPHAQRIVTMHPLKAGDAMQLAAAIAAADGQPDQLPVVTRDHTLAKAAQLEGFPVIIPA